ncbi:MAG: NifU family protein, partial [Chitinispirillaceae bacterium]|nr:NifU family protein [Chitinispirillaceae bacterium]
GKTLEEVKKITNKDIAEALGGLPKEKMHCSVMGEEALEAAIRYYETGGATKTPSQKEGRIVCKCFNVTEKEIEDAVRENNLTTIEDVTNFTKAGGACGKCHQDIQNIIDKIRKEKGEYTKNQKELTNLQKIDLIRDVIDKEIKPMLQADGGDCELVDINGNVVTVKLKGHCSGCAFSGITLINVIEKKLKEKVTPDITVKQI